MRQQSDNIQSTFQQNIDNSQAPIGRFKQRFEMFAFFHTKTQTKLSQQSDNHLIFYTVSFLPMYFCRVCGHMPKGDPKLRRRGEHGPNNKIYICGHVLSEVTFRQQFQNTATLYGKNLEKRPSNNIHTTFAKSY